MAGIGGTTIYRVSAMNLDCDISEAVLEWVNQPAWVEVLSFVPGLTAATAASEARKNDTVTLNVETIDALIKADETLTITQGGTELRLTAEMLKTLEATNGNVQISIAPLSNEIFAELVTAALASSNGDITLAAEVLNITVTVDGKEVKEFPQPLEISIDITASELAKGQIEKLSGVRLNNDGTMINRLGGSYNEKTKQFSFFTSKLSMYSVIVAEDLVNLYMTLNSSGYTLNNVKRSLDVPPVIKDGRTLVPVRLIAESFGAKVDWDDATKTVTIHLDGKSLKLTIGQKLSGRTFRR